ncbi:MAG: FixH family protein [Lewinellaceae bacterium]|nr:FixH family protein [Lewinellaceae bacterium]
MKFNWGTGIAIVYSIFVLGMLGAVFASRQSDPGLVRKDYYDLDLHYQDRMDKKQNAANLAGGLPIRFDAAQQAVVLQFPMSGGAPEGNIKLFRSSTLDDDISLDIEADANGQMLIPAGQMAKGLWHIEVDWKAGSKTYFKEQTIILTNA